MCEEAKGIKLKKGTRFGKKCNAPSLFSFLFLYLLSLAKFVKEDRI